MKPDTYHPVHDAEAERQLERIKKIDETLEKINAVMAEEMQRHSGNFCITLRRQALTFRN